MAFGEYTGIRDEFPYEALAGVKEAQAESYCKSLRRQFRNKSKEPHSLEEWLVRTYAAVKLILSASVMLSSARYAAAKALRIVEPYLLYYALLNTSRALMLVVPGQSWNDGRLLDETTHTKTLNVAANQLRHLSADAAKEYEELARQTRAARELFSYRFPATGLRGPVSDSLPEPERVVGVCAYVAEAAQLNSECLESEFKPLRELYGDFPEMPLRRVFEYEHKSLDGPIDDPEDYYRLGYILGKVGRPRSLYSTATEGLVEDFFAAWDFSGAGSGDGDEYRPADWGIIFPFQ